MARERYLVGVSKEELEYKPPAPPPMTPKGKWENIWYHYKWAILGGVFAVVVLTVLIVQMVTREKPDYRVCLAISGYVPEGVVERLEDELERYGEDLNEDGEVLVSIQMLDIGLSEAANNQIAMANRQAVFAHIVARDVPIFMFDSAFYGELCENLGDGTTGMFEPLNLQHEMVSEDGNYFTLDLLAFAKQQFPDIATEAWEKQIPADLAVGVRVIGDSIGDAERTAHEEAVALLKRYVTAQEVS